MSKEVLSEETTTLPEGAQLSICRCKTARGKPFTELWVSNKKSTIRMRVDNVAQPNLSSYLELAKREIQRHRARLKPGDTGLDIHPKDFAELVSAMLANKMFIVVALDEAS